MPTFARRTLRQRLGTLYLRDTLVGKTTGTGAPVVDVGTGIPHVDVIDQAQADYTASGMALYERSAVRCLNASAGFLDARVGSFNVGSGAFSLLTTGTTVNKGIDYEVHSLLPPAEKDALLTEAAARTRTLQWNMLDSIAGNTYSLGPEVLDVVDVAINPYPVGSSTGYSPRWWRFYPDEHQSVLRLDSALPASSELAYRAVTTQTLGSGDGDTVDLPDDDGLLARAAAGAYWLLERRAPAQEVQVYQRARAEMMQRARAWALAHPTDAARKIQLDDWL